MDERTYEKTHPWLKFTLDLQNAPVEFWMLLGEIKSKCEHIAGVPLDKHTADALYSLYLSRGVQATTAIEGNTLTEEQVLQRIEGKRDLPESLVYQGREVDNIVEACNAILANLTENRPIMPSVELIKKFNREVLAGLPLDAGIVAGEIRKKPVFVGSYRGAPAEECELLLEKMCAFLLTESNRQNGLHPITRGVVLAIWAHIYLAWIHPFGDGNGRTARLLEFRRFRLWCGWELRVLS
jgi:Fic family protein